MKLTILFATLLLSAVYAQAQSPLTFGGMNNLQPGFRQFRVLPDSNALRNKWSVSKYVGFTASYGTLGSFVSTPIGLQLNRKLTDNLYAFAGVSVAPTYFQFNRAFLPAKNGFMNANNYGIVPAAEMGLMYINNDRTFSISGSIGVSRYYNTYSPFFAPPVGHPKQ